MQNIKINKKILLISWSDFYGGAAKAAYNTYFILKSITKKVDFFVQKKITNNKDIKTYKKLTVNLLLRKIFSFLFYKLRFSRNIHSYNFINSDLLKVSNAYDYDVVNIHWFGSETIAINQLVTLKKKIVLTLHDMWAFCGTEHYLFEKPDDYFLNGHKANIFFIDKFFWKLKKKYLKKNIKIITPSNWLKKLAKQSKIMKDFEIKVIPYHVNNKIFFKKKITRTFLKKKINKKNINILFVSASKLYDYRKGFDILDDALFNNNVIPNYKLFIIGKVSESDKKKIKSNYCCLGEITNQNKLSKLYNLSDLLVIPSRIDNLPNVGLEAHSCGLPIVSFKVGGLTDIVDHMRTGYLAKPFNKKDLINGIKVSFLKKFSFSSNAIIKSKVWSKNNIQKKYINFFNKI